MSHKQLKPPTDSTVAYKQLRPPTNNIIKAIYSILKIKFPELFLRNIKVLDLFAGTGSFGIMMLDKAQTDYCVFVEKSFSSWLKLEKLRKTKYVNRCKVIRTDVLKFNFNLSFDVIFIDPPYAFKMSNIVLSMLEKQPWVTKDTVICLRKDIEEEFTYSGNLEYVHEYVSTYNQVIFFKKTQPIN